MANFIEELYYGNIDPQVRGYRPKSPVKRVSDSLNGLEEKLTEQLVGENKELFLRFCNAYAEFMGECELDTFITRLPPWCPVYDGHLPERRSPV